MKRLIQSWSGFATLLGFALIQFGPSNGQSKDEKVRTIPLKQVYSTNGQKGLIPVSRSMDTHYSGCLNRITQAEVTGPPNIFLVRANTISSVIEATSRAFGAYSSDVPTIASFGSPKHELWLVSYFGTAGSDPPEWLIESVEHQGKVIRMKYHRPKKNISTQDNLRYLAWAPLGQLPAGTYSLEMFDTMKNQVVLTRLVTVEETKK